MKVSEILIATGGKLISGDETMEITGFSQDSRQVCKGMMYIPIIGERYDGHAFIDSAFENGASAVITDRLIADDKHIVIKVDDTLKALQEMARYWRKHRDVKVVGITGSVGKTSTRDMVYSVVKQQYKTLKTEGNYNNNIGLPLTILRLKDEEVMILEMGMNHLKEMEELSLIAHPDISAITNVGTAHIGELGSRENILKAKLEITAGMLEGSTLIINGDNDMLSTVALDDLKLVKVAVDSEAEFKAEDVVLKDDHSEFDIYYNGENHHVIVPVPGKHFILNALVAIVVGVKLNIPMEKCIWGIERFELTKNRMDVIELKNDITLIDGTYNASEDSMKSSIDVLATYNRRKIAVLADMLELGQFSEQLHRNVGKHIADKQIDLLVAVGKEAKFMVDGAKDAGMTKICYCNDNQEVVNYLKNNLQSGDVVLLKGSNGMRLKEVVTKIGEIIMKQKLIVLCGGQSSEHIVSRMSCTSVLNNLDKNKYELTLVGIDIDGRWYYLDQNQTDLAKDTWLGNSEEVTDIYGLLKSHDVAFPVLHGMYGEDGTIQGLFELAKIPYVGCRVMGSSVAMDKIYTKKILDTVGIPQVKSVYVKKRYDDKLVVVNNKFDEIDDIEAHIVKELGMPCFIKASRSGSSVGCYRCDNREELISKLNEAAKYDRHVVVEECVDCIELETAVLGNDDVIVSRVGQIMPHGEFYTFESKYEDEESKTCIPALVDEKIQEQIREYALKVFKAVDGHGLSRVDFFLDRKTNKIYLNEINTMPGFTKISMYPQLMNDFGISYSELLDRLIVLAMQR